MYNCILTGNTAVQGGGAAGGTSYDCTFSNNSVSASGLGGGTYRGTLNNCVLSSNQSGGYGGGACLSTLNNCTLRGNSASYAGGAYEATLNNCTLIENQATYGGGTYGDYFSPCLVNNCIVYYNTAAVLYADYGPYTILNFSCTAPMPGSGRGNVTNEPLFIDLANGNLRLQSNSPCINAGNNAYASDGPDLDGNPRIVGGTVDIGAYEFQYPTSLISYAWLQSYGLPTDGSADFIDSDADEMNNWQEWRASTNPTNALSVLKMLSASANASGIAVQWQSVSGVTYYLQRGTNLSIQPVFSSLQSNLAGQVNTTTYTDTNAIGSGPFFYRVGVQ